VARWGEFQSLFQLSTALNVGVSGIISLWEDPNTAHRRQVEKIKGRVLVLPIRHTDLSEHHKGRVTETAGKCDADEALSEKVAGLDIGTIVFTIKIVSVALAIFGLVLLKISSDSYSLAISDAYRTVAIGLFIPMPVMIVALLYISHVVRGRLKARRIALDACYRQLVVELWGN
jgi:hypothetical protein